VLEKTPNSRIFLSSLPVEKMEKFLPGESDKEGDGPSARPLNRPSVIVDRGFDS
jgi:hypothetical protein